ncbi:hypothetical protein CMI45_00995 [Candidatus Pacearchaeota archaeon]|nr:hypothetical protein [Candidatus Pacearchaeota archaeon]|tara:strand:+ start:146 stop:382 length:237 start_codon:yes stop_codon:yes gene_type:complete
MAKDNKIQMPGAFGGLMRYDEEYNSRFMMSPVAVIVFVVLIVILVLLLKVIFPANIVPVDTIGSVPISPHGLILSLLE